MTKNVRIAVAVTAAAIAIGVVALFVAGIPQRFLKKHPEPASNSSVVELEVGDKPPIPSIWIDVHSPDRVWKSLRTNAWLSRVLSEPLGQGMTAGWSGFLSTRGGDLAGAFEGLVLDVIADKLLASPFRLVFYSGPNATGAPAFLIPNPSHSALKGYDLLNDSSGLVTHRAARCPGSDEKSAEPIDVSRWLIASQALFAGQRKGAVALAKTPLAVVQALCSAPPASTATKETDLTVTFSRDGLGREAQLAFALLGLGPTPRMAFALNGERLEPRGFIDELGEPGRLDSAPPPESMLKTIPADVGVVFVASLRLPEKLTQDSLKRHLEKSYQGNLVARPVAVIWNPRGSDKFPTEVAVLWPAQDAALLQDAFSGPNTMARKRLCGFEVLSSTEALAGTLQKTCEGKRPSILNGAPPVVEGLKQPLSVGVGLNVGLVLSHLLGDAYASDENAKKGAAEIDTARRLLEELPFIGLRGVAKGGSLVPGGFRS